VVIVLGQGGSGGGRALPGEIPSTAHSPLITLRKTAPAPAPSLKTLSVQGASSVHGKQAVHAAASRGPAGPQGPQNPTGSSDSFSQAANPPAPAYGTVSPPTAGRQVIQGAQLALSTSARRVDQVAQEVFNVVSQQRGIVKSSSVTANGSRGGYAQFQLSLPSGHLAPTMSALSNLSFAHVISRTDSSQDVTNQYDVDQRKLADARALRASLLKQLAAAVTQAQLDSLTIRIHDAESAITADESTLHSLEHQIGYSQIFVSIDAGGVPLAVHHSSGALTLGRAAHDAGKVLTVAAGVALIGLAALLPVALVLALAWWIYAALRRRRRLQALDLY
jgi:hypothetical protein